MSELFTGINSQPIPRAAPPVRAPLPPPSPAQLPAPLPGQAPPPAQDPAFAQQVAVQLYELMTQQQRAAVPPAAAPPGPPQRAIPQTAAPAVWTPDQPVQAGPPPETLLENDLCFLWEIGIEDLRITPGYSREKGQYIRATAHRHDGAEESVDYHPQVSTADALRHLREKVAALPKDGGLRQNLGDPNTQPQSQYEKELQSEKYRRAIDAQLAMGR